jgi:hypothetical protein
MESRTSNLKEMSTLTSTIRFARTFLIARVVRPRTAKKEGKTEICILRTVLSFIDTHDASRSPFRARRHMKHQGEVFFRKQETKHISSDVVFLGERRKETHIRLSFKTFEASARKRT